MKKDVKLLLTLLLMLGLVAGSLTACSETKMQKSGKPANGSSLEKFNETTDKVDKTKLKKETGVNESSEAEESSEESGEESGEEEVSETEEVPFEGDEAFSYTPEDFDPDTMLWVETYLEKGKDNYDFTLEGVEYNWPIMLSDITDNGWEIDEYFLNQDIEAGSYGSLLATKGDKEISLSVVNKKKEVQDITQCNVSNIRVSYYNQSDASTKVDFKVSADGVSLGGTNKEEILSGFNWDKEISQPEPETEGSTMTSYTKVENVTLSDGYDAEIGRVIYVFETPEDGGEDYLAQVSIEYIGE